MKETIVVADSGGSGTTFCYYDSEERVQTLEIDSLHPRYVFDWTTDQINEFELNTQFIRDKQLIFYGAGCAQQEVANRMKNWLMERGFVGVTVFPDTLGACRALVGNEAGTVAILGTGSVVLIYNGISIEQQIGGFGPLIGDEGSGFYFGKLLVQNLLNSKDEFKDEFRTIFKNKATLKKQLASPNLIQWLSTLAKETQLVQCDEIHQANFKQFTQLYLQQIRSAQSSKTLHIVGSYGCSQNKNLEKVLSDYNWRLGTQIKNPVITLLHFHVNQLFSKS